jgi:hypothetical protein
MPRFAITEKAGRIVAGYSNTGVGSVLQLSDKAAKVDVEAGRLVALDQKRKAKKASSATATGPGKTEAKPDTD